jgi:hypothetical protein
MKDRSYDILTMLYLMEIMASNEWADDYCMKISDNSWFDNSVKELLSKINPG